MINTTNTSDLARLGGLGSPISPEKNQTGISKDGGSNIAETQADKYTKSSSHELRMAELKQQISSGEYSVDLSGVSEKMTKLMKGDK
jgi:anti-sigma28 factor (negative regulator of flagellin synthesis)